MPDVLILCEYATVSGGERSMLAVLDGVRRAGYCVSVAAPPAGPLADALHARNVDLVPFDTHACGERPCATAGLSSSGSGTVRQANRDTLRQHLRAILAERKPDLLHANSLSMGRLSGPVAAALGVASIAHLRDIIRLSRQAIGDLNRHRRILAVSEATRAFHVAAGLAAEKTHVLYNGVDPERFRPRPATGYLHRSLGLPPGVPLVGSIGQIGIRKGLDVLARAATMLQREMPEVHYLIVGQRWSDKSEARRFEADLQAVASGELSGRMHFLGYRDDMPEVLNELTVLAHPSRQEPLGRVLLEAAASGVAVVATNVGGTREIFPPGTDSARLVPPDDAASLAAAISEFVRDQSLRCRVAAAARRRAEEAFDVSVAAMNLVAHYREARGGGMMG